MKLATKTCLFIILLSTSSYGQELSAPVAISDSETAPDSFEQLFEQWKTILGRLREIQVEYRIAENDELEALRTEFHQLVKEGQHLVPRIRSAGIAEYRESPGGDEEITKFLASMLSDEIKSDNYEPAFEMAEALMEGGFDDERISDWAGVAAFATNRFDLADKWLRQAQENRSISAEGMSFLPEVDNYKRYWKEEQAIREGEAKANDLPRVTISTTKGDIVVELFENQAPQTVGNFVNLVEKRFYDGIVFHRVLNHFMAQAGCPDGIGQGGPGYNIYCECYRGDYRKHFRGTLSMAKGQPRDTGGSQFFLTFVPTHWLNGKHTAFGRVMEGMDVLAKIKRRNPEDPKAPSPDRIISAKMLRKRDHDYVPTKVR